MTDHAYGGQRPYYAVIFSSRRADGDHGYEAMAESMEQLAAGQPGFIGVESVRGTDGAGITVSYWESLEAIRGWKENPLHMLAQSKGREIWYSHYSVKICRVEHGYGGGDEDVSRL